MSGEIEVVLATTVATQREYRWRGAVPAEHRTSLDTRLKWLWNQRFGTVQMVYQQSDDVLDRTAATLLIQAIMGRDLVAIRQILQRLEGGSQFDDEIMNEDGSLPI